MALYRASKEQLEVISAKTERHLIAWFLVQMSENVQLIVPNAISVRTENSKAPYMCVNINITNKKDRKRKQSISFFLSSKAIHQVQCHSVSIRCIDLLVPVNSIFFGFVTFRSLLLFLYNSMNSLTGHE